MSDANQITFTSLNDLVAQDHPYRKYLQLVNFDHLCVKLHKHLHGQQELGYGTVILFKALLLQVMEDLSDRQLERFLQENMAAKLFCGFGLKDKTPCYSLFSKVRKRIGTHRLSKLFKKLQQAMLRQGILRQTFTMIDATHLISKNKLWEERDKALAKKYETLNNAVLPKVAHDQQASIGCKGKHKFWYGYKQQVSVDMQTGLINKVAVTSAKVTDGQGARHVLPDGGLVVGDKAYCTQRVSRALARRGCHDGTIKKNNMKGKDRSKDKWLTFLRSPYERVFSQLNHRTNYVGLAKNQFRAFLYAISHNLKRLVVLSSPPILVV